jgi:MFS transporter, YNFM family, putative membrane transport protein
MRLDRRQAAIALAAFCAFLDLYAPQPLLPLLSRELGVASAEAGLTISATTFAVALIAPFAGTVADVLGRKRVIVAAMLALALPTALAGSAETVSALVFWRFVQGLLLPPVFAVTVAYIGEEFAPEEVTSVTGLYLSASSVGGFLGRFLTGLMVGPIGWRGAFFVLAALTLACGAGVLWLLPHERSFRRSAGLLASARQMVGHCKNPWLRATYGVGFGVLFAFIATFTYVNYYLAAPPFGLSPASLGAIFVVYLLGAVLTPLTGAGVRRLGRRRLVLSLIALWALSLALTLLASLPAVITGLAVAAGCGFICQAVATGFVAITAREGRSSAVGLYATSYYVGGTVGGVLPGFAWERAGWPGAVAMVLVVLGLMALTVQRFWRD